MSAALPALAAQPMLPTISSIFAALTVAHGMSTRDSQLALAADVRDVLATGRIGCFEAPTGTGKTLAYLAGALEQQAHTGDPIPVVVATATVGLQEQIIRYDVPRLVAIGALDPRKVAIAKGRGRYFCPRTAAVLEDKKLRDGQFDMFQPDKHVSDSGAQIGIEMLKAWRTKAWDGDQDSWPGELPNCWGSTCAASSETCVNRACDHFSTCPYMASRAKLASAELIIANHDLVLADLAQRADEQTTTALPPKRYALIFDEAHNLPKKAINTKQATARLTETDWLRKLEAYGEGVRATARVVKAFEKNPDCSLEAFGRGAAELIASLTAFAGRLAATQTFSVSGTFSWGLEAPPDSCVTETHALACRALELVIALQLTAKVFSEIAEEAVGADKGFAIRYLAETHRFARQAKDLQNGLALFCSRDKLVRWVLRNREGQLSLHSQPIEGRDVLEKLLWQTNFPVVMVSATLQIAGSFERFRYKTGMPGPAITRAFPPVFDYRRGLLHCPPMAAAPGEAGYELSLQDRLIKLYEREISPGMLVLFTSRETMRRVVATLPFEMREHMLTPDHGPVPELVARHKQRIDDGQRSILVGLDSMSEGLDLPGRYCGHVVITRLPFAVPGDPVEEARRMLMGKAWFEQAYLADMLITLIQAAGRLIRREDDHGVITVLDSRLTSKRYSALALQALPQFQFSKQIALYFDEMVPDLKLDTSHGVKPAAPPEPAKGPALYLAHSQSAPAVASPTAPVKAVAVTTTPAMAAKPVVPDNPFAGLERLTKLPMAASKPIVVGELETVCAALQRVAPALPGPFDDKVAYLPAEVPALPLRTPAAAWAERQMAEATLLGLLYCNLPWDTGAPAWQQILRLRPDAVQFASVLNSHLVEDADSRRATLDEAACRRALTQIWSGMPAPSDEALLSFLGELASAAYEILSRSHRWPAKEVLLELSDAAMQLARQLRTSPR